MSDLFSNIFGNAFQPANVSTSITPRQPFDSNSTQHSVNQSVASNQRSNSLPAIMKQLYSPSSGFSMGPANMAQAAGPLSQSYAQNNSIRAMQPLSDYSQNAQMLLGGQQARENEGLGLASLYGNMQDVGFSQGMNNAQNGLGLLQALGIFGQ